jgi:serine/threonine-protein kinase
VALEYPNPAAADFGIRAWLMYALGSAMLPAQVEEALSMLTSALARSPQLNAALHARWRGENRGETLPDAVRVAADMLDKAMPTLTKTQGGIADLGALFGKSELASAGDVVLTWCAANAARRDVRMARVLSVAVQQESARDFAIAAARDRIIEGPLHDALGCVPLVGTGDVYSLPENAEAAARLEVLIWEAGASALSVPELGQWIWGNHATFDALVVAPAHGSLRGRVLASRCLEVSAKGLSPTTDPELVGKTLQVLQPLLLHPEPLVWVHAARSLGRLTGTLEQLEGTLLDWVRGDSQLLRQRAMTAFASLPGERLKMLGSELSHVIDAEEVEPWALAAIAAATPYLFHERKDMWDRLAARILAGDGGAIASRALARGLSTLWRRGTMQSPLEAPLRELRDNARRARGENLDEWRRWLEVIAITDPVDGAERDPLDLELGLENLVRMAAQYDDEEADARAARFADTLGPTFVEARRIALGGGSLRHRAAAINAFEGCARSLALRLWGPLLATRPAGDPIEEPNLGETWKLVSRAPEELLSVLEERRAAGTSSEDDLPLEVLAIRLGGYALDALGQDSDLGPGRGPVVHDTCVWVSKIDGLADGSRELPSSLKNALSSLFWRLVDTTRGSALGEIDDTEWLGPFAAWWGLVLERPAMLRQLSAALPMMSTAALETCTVEAETLRAVMAEGLEDGAWGAAAETALENLHASETELAAALEGFASALASFATAASPKPNLEAMCLELVLSAERLQAALADPVKALHPASDASVQDSLSRQQTENAPRVAQLVARVIRRRELSKLDVWFASLGPITSALVEKAVRGACKRSPPPPPPSRKPEPRIIEGYELIKPLGEGGIGSVWQVRKPGADRFFVLKIPKADALAQASDTEREGILASFVEEAKALAGLYHPNVANIIDRGVSGAVPFLVLELLIGADLKMYSAAKPMSLFELRQVVPESCAGLAALHGAGLVHRDIKPANLWLRLPLAGNERFDPQKHRDPARAQPLATVVIDFGMVRGIKVAADAAGRFVAGTPGYIAPEQVLDPVELDPRSDVYALIGTIYNVTTGRTFFDDIENPRDRIIAHMNRDPWEDADRLKPYPAALQKLFRAATAKDPRDRPHPLELGREFSSASRVSGRKSMAVVLALTSALAHAGWNALLKKVGRGALACHQRGRDPRGADLRVADRPGARAALAVADVVHGSWRGSVSAPGGGRRGRLPRVPGPRVRGR